MPDNSNSNIPESEALLNELQYIDACKQSLNHKLEFSSYEPSSRTLNLISST